MSMNKERFDQLTEGILFMSKTDAPLTYYEPDPERSRQWPPSKAADFLQLIGEDPGTPVEQLAPEKFFSDLRPGNEDRESQVAALLLSFRRVAVPASSLLIQVNQSPFVS
jgi:hypothetical protein